MSSLEQRLLLQFAMIHSYITFSLQNAAAVYVLWSVFVRTTHSRLDYNMGCLNRFSLHCSKTSTSLICIFHSPASSDQLMVKTQELDNFRNITKELRYLLPVLPSRPPPNPALCLFGQQIILPSSPILFFFFLLYF